MTKLAAELALELGNALKNTLVLVLAGGRGARLKSLTDVQAKPAVPFGGKFRLIDFPLSNCIHSGLRRVGVLTQYRAHTLIQHVQRGWGFFRGELNEFVQVWPAQQQTEDESWYRGTADAVFQNLELIRRHHPHYVLILGGDHIYKQDYSKMLMDHITKGADLTVSCVEVPLDDAREFGVMAVDGEDFITSFVEKPDHPPPIPDRPDRALASMGIYIFTTGVLMEQLARDAANPASSHDFGKDLLPYLVPRTRVLAHRFSRSCVRPNPGDEPYWRDVGTVDAFWEANLDLTTVTPALNLYDKAWPIWTYQVQRPSAKFVFDNEERRGMAVDSVISGGCVVSGSTVRRSLLFTDVRVNSYSLVEDSILLPGCTVGRHCRLRKVIVGQDCVVPDGLVVGEERELDQQRFFRTPKGVVLVTAASLARLRDREGIPPAGG